MASEMTFAISILFALLRMQSVLALGEGRVECEKLSVEMCAFTVSSSGSRCVLEKKYSFADVTHESSVQYQFQSSGVMAEKMKEWIESDECVQACGLERTCVGMSTDEWQDGVLSFTSDVFDQLNQQPPYRDANYDNTGAIGLFVIVST